MVSLFEPDRNLNNDVLGVMALHSPKDSPEFYRLYRHRIQKRLIALLVHTAKQVTCENIMNKIIWLSNWKIDSKTISFHLS
eukprot:UN16256